MQKRGVPIPPIVSCSGSKLYNLYKYIANILKKIKDKNVEDEKNNAKNSTMFPNYISNVPILDDNIMVSRHFFVQEHSCYWYITHNQELC